MKARFEPPPRLDVEGEYSPGYRTYSEYNYLNPGIGSWIKKRHFDIALDLVEDTIGKALVLDCGCADGVFLPTLSRNFPKVVAIDISSEFVKLSKEVVRLGKLDNVKVVCCENRSFKEIADEITERFDVVFLLEVMEHIGERNHMYESKTEFLRSLRPLLAPTARIVISVPKMVGPGFLLQRLGLRLLKMHREELTWGELLKASLFYGTKTLEKRWDPLSHLGFNHHKFFREIARHFRIMKKRSGLFQIILVVQLD